MIGVSIVYFSQLIITFVIYLALFSRTNMNPDDDEEFLTAISFCLSIISNIFVFANLTSECGLVITIIIAMVLGTVVNLMSNFLIYMCYDIVKNNRWKG
jgi:hypothetical protein